MSLKQPIKDELSNAYLRQKYGSIGGDYWTDLSEKERAFMLGLKQTFSIR